MLHVTLWRRYTVHYSTCAQLLSCIRLFATPWTVVHQAPLSMGFSRQEYWSRLLFSPLGDLPNPGIKLMSPALVGGSFTEPPGKPHTIYHREGNKRRAAK